MITIELISQLRESTKNTFITFNKKGLTIETSHLCLTSLWKRRVSRSNRRSKRLARKHTLTKRVNALEASGSNNMTSVMKRPSKPRRARGVRHCGTLSIMMRMSMSSTREPCRTNLGRKRPRNSILTLRTWHLRCRDTRSI